MGLQLETIVPWGRNLAEYVAMFGLTQADLLVPILDCGAGPASFTAEMTHQGHRVIACDPIYQFSAEEIDRQIQATYPVIVAGVRANYDSYVWQEIRSPEALGQVRLNAMRQFLQDFPAGLASGRYQVGELPTLPFGDRQFDLALCGHLLFTYADQLSPEFHLAAIHELCRVAIEVRIFPLLKISGELAPVLLIVLDDLSRQGYHLEIQPVSYEFQRGGNQMLRIRANG